MKLVVVAFIAAMIVGGGSVKADLHIGDAELMDEAINHPSSRGVLGGSLSHDGLRLYFSMERDGGYGSFDIWVCERESLYATWGEAVNLGPSINSHLSEEGPEISPDELELYFSSGERSGDWVFHTMRSIRASKDEPWGPATEYTDLFPNDFSSDGLALYFTAWWDTGYGNRDIWMVTRATTDDDWGNVVNLGPNVNDELYQSGPSISHDDLALFFNDKDGIYVRMSVRRTRDGDWGPAVDISAPLCPDHQKRFSPDISPNGRVLYFHHHDWGAFTERKFWQASITPMVDFTGDGMVDLSDLSAMIECWGTDYSFCDIGPMPWGDGVVDEADLEVLMSYYGQAVDYSAESIIDVTPPHNPQPADGWTTDVEKALPISWAPGDKNTVHDLFLGTDRDAVENANISDTSGVYRGEQSGNSYMPPEGVQAGQTYYWRLDEVKSEDYAKKGEVWSFTVIDGFIVDNFESYTDEVDEVTFEGPTIWNTWIDSFVNGTGSLSGYEFSAKGTFCETEIVHAGRQAMPFTFDNDGTLFDGREDEMTGLLYYSEVQRTWAEPQDWTRRGVETLVLWFHGDPDNSVEPMYVSLEDSSGKSDDVMYTDLPSPTTIDTWQHWGVDLAEFVGVDLKAIKKMAIRIGDKENTEPGGSGVLYIDDIELHLPSMP